MSGHRLPSPGQCRCLCAPLAISAEALARSAWQRYSMSVLPAERDLAIHNLSSSPAVCIRNCKMSADLQPILQSFLDPAAEIAELKAQHEQLVAVVKRSGQAVAVLPGRAAVANSAVGDLLKFKELKNPDKTELGAEYAIHRLPPVSEVASPALLGLLCRLLMLSVRSISSSVRLRVAEVDAGKGSITLEVQRNPALAVSLPMLGQTILLKMTEQELNCLVYA